MRLEIPLLPLLVGSFVGAGLIGWIWYEHGYRIGHAACEAQAKAAEAPSNSVAVENPFIMTTAQQIDLLRTANHVPLRSDKEHLRLFVGNSNHHPVIEWIADIDPSANHGMSIMQARGPSSLADEGLVIAWMFPERIRAIDDKKWPAFLLAGYEINPNGNSRPWWEDTVVVYSTWIGMSWGGDGSSYSVPRE